MKRAEIRDPELNMLVQRAQACMQDAYAPYSQFYVGAAILLDNGEVITGSNQENAAYPACMCAERVALYAKSSLHPRARIRRMALVAMSGLSPDLVPATPCGSCRQVLLEFEARQNNNFEILMQVERDNWIIIPSAQHLLPFGFTSKNING